MGKWQMHQNVPSDRELEEYARRQQQRNASIKGPGTMPAHLKWAPGEWGRWLDLEKRLKAKLDSITGDRKSSLAEEVKAIINESYDGKPSEGAVNVSSQTMADYCIALKLFPSEFNEVFDEATKEEMIRNKDSDRGAWPYPMVDPQTDDKWAIYLQQLYLHRLSNAAFPMYWLHEHFPDIYRVALQKGTFSKSITQLIEKDTEKLNAAINLSKELPSWFNEPSKYAGYRDKAERYGTGEELLDPVVTYFGKGGKGEDLRPILDTDTKRQALFFLSKGGKYQYMDAVAEIAGIQQAILEAEDVNRLLFLAWTKVDQRASDNEASIRANLEALYRNGRGALEMGLDRVL